QGFPRGITGMSLACVWRLMLGELRRRSGHFNWKSEIKSAALRLGGQIKRPVGPLGRRERESYVLERMPPRCKTVGSFSINSKRRRALPFGVFLPDSQASTVLLDTPQTEAKAV